MRALLRRAERDDDELLRFGDLELEPGTREVRRGGERIELTRTEFALLELFLRNPRQVLTRSLIFERVWGYDFGLSSNSLDVYIGYLRRKTEVGGRPRLIHTVRGVGYALREPVTFRVRLAVASAAAVALAVALAAPLVYVAVRSELRGQVDDGAARARLRRLAPAAAQRSPRTARSSSSSRRSGPARCRRYVQWRDEGRRGAATGAVRPDAGATPGTADLALPPETGRAVAAGAADRVLRGRVGRRDAPPGHQRPDRCAPGWRFRSPAR